MPAALPSPAATPARRDRLAVGRTVATLLLLMGAGYFLVFGTASWEALTAPARQVFHEDGYKGLALALTPERSWLLRILTVAMVMSGAGGLGLLRRQAPSGIRPQLGLAAGYLRRWWWQLPVGVQMAVGGLGLAIAAARVYYALALPLSTDEVASYDYFVNAGPRSILSYYPIPNNHLLYNLLAWPLRLAGAAPAVVMRLPGLGLALAGTLLTVPLLARLLGLSRALAVTGLVALAPLSVYYGAVGRGYGIQLVAVQLCFFATLEILRPRSPFRQLSWAVFIMGSVAGLFLVPSFALPLAAMGLLLLVQQRAGLRTVLLAGLGITVVCVARYAPVGLVSGWGRLLANRYVAARAGGAVLAGFRGQLYEVAAELLELPLRLSGPLLLGLAALGSWSGQLLPKGRQRTAAQLAGLLLAVPLAMLLLQRVFPLARVLLFMPWAVAVLLALGLSRWPARAWPVSATAPLVVAGVVLLGLARLMSNEGRVAAIRNESRLLHQAYTWLHQHPVQSSGPAQIGLQAPMHELFFAHYRLAEPLPAAQLESYRTTRPVKKYDVIILSHAAERAGALAPAPLLPRYRDALVTIYTTEPAGHSTEQP